MSAAEPQIAQRRLIKAVAEKVCGDSHFIEQVVNEMLLSDIDPLSIQKTDSIRRSFSRTAAARKIVEDLSRQFIGYSTTDPDHVERLIRDGVMTRLRGLRDGLSDDRLIGLRVGPTVFDEQRPPEIGGRRNTIEIVPGLFLGPNNDARKSDALQSLPAIMRGRVEELALVISEKRPWVVAGVLNWINSRMTRRSERLNDLPRPKAGAGVENAEMWPVLWLVGQRSLFPRNGRDPRQATRARNIRILLDFKKKVIGDLQDRYEVDDFMNRHG